MSVATMMDKGLVEKILGAVENGNSRTLNSLLECKLLNNNNNNAAVIGAALHPSSDRARDLLEAWQSQLNSTMTGSTGGESSTAPFSAVQGLQALLLIRPWYVTPWAAITEFTTKCLDMRIEEFYVCVSAVEVFLQEASSSIGARSVSASGCDESIIRAIKDAIDRLLDGLRLCPNDRAFLLCDLISSLFFFAKKHCNGETVEKLNLWVFQRKLSSVTIHVWIRLVQRLRSMVTAMEMDTARDSTLKYLKQHGLEIAVGALRTIMNVSMEVATHTVVEGNYLSWYQIPIQILFAATSRREDYASLDDHLSNMLTELTTTRLNDFWKVFDAETSGPEWVRVNILLIICQCTQNSTSGVISELFSQAVEKEDSTSQDDDYSIPDCQARLLDILYPKEETIAQLGLSDDFETDKVLLVELLGDVAYGGVGIFVDPDDTRVVSLSRAAKLLLSIVWIGNPAGRESDAYLRRKSVEIVKLARSYIFGGKVVQEARTMLFFITSVALLYIESPCCRGMVVDTIRQGLLCEGSDLIRTNSCIAAVALIAGSRHQKDLDLHFLEPCTSLLHQPLDAETFMQLAASVSSCKSARGAVLSSSKALLDRSYCGAWEERDDVETRSDDMARAGLLGLLELLRSSPWDRIALESWFILSDSIVMDTPPLHVSDRTWLYEQISDLLQDEELDESAANHFLRATIARLGKFVLKETPEFSARFVAENAFIVWEDPAVGLIQTRQTEDLVGLLRLSLSLLFHNFSEKVDASSLDQAVKIHDLFVYHVLFSYTRRTKIDDRRTSSEALKACFKDSSKNEFMLQFCMMATYFAAVFDYLTHMEESQADFQGFVPQGNGYEVLEQGLGCVVKQESEAIDDDLTRVSAEMMLPQWFTTGTDTLMSSREVDVEPSSMVLVHSSLCEFLVEFLCGQTLRNVRRRERPVNVCRKLVRAVGCVLELKQNLRVQAMNTETNDHPSTLHTLTITSTAAEFFSAASRVVQDIVSQNSPLEDAEEHLTSIVHFCQAIGDSPGEMEMEVWLVLLRSLWTLYHVVGSEKGASRFVAYLESNVTTEAAVSKTDVSKTDNSVCSLKSIRSADDVDNSIRGIRVAVLTALERCLQLASPSEIQSVSGAGSVETSALSEVLDADSTFIASILREIVQDLKAGLEGHSGGITTEMYESYLASIQTCVTLIYHFLMSTDIGATPGFLSIFAKVVKSIRGILRSFPLPDATLFRSSLITAAAEFPSIIRGMLRDHLMTRPMDSFEMCKLMNPESELVSGLFEDCIFILTRWGSLRDPNSVPWEDIAGRLHTEGTQNGSQIFPQEQSTRDGTSDGETLDQDAPKYPTDKTANQIEVSLGRKELWSWALSCTFLALEENWRESFRSIVYDMRRPERFVDNAALGTMLNFLSWRQKDLLLSLERIARLFKSSTAVVESQTQAAVLDMLAMNLPSAPRIRFCQLVATVSKVLKFSIDQLCSILDTGSAGACKIYTKICFLEALGAVGAWLVLDDSNADFTVGTFRWLSILRRKRPPGEHPSKRIDTTELLPWVEKTSLLVRDLHASLRNFEKVLSGKIDVDGLGPAFRTFFSGGLSEIIRLSKRKLRLVELAMPSEYAATSLPDFPTLSETNTTKKRQTRRHSSIRPKKRAAITIAKSRNPIVNAFMSLDRKNDGQDGAPSDAFVDLEDFLVEG